MSTDTVLLHGMNNNGASHKKQALGKEISYYFYNLLIYIDKKIFCEGKKGAFSPISQQSAP
jgi:hypothetical protein